MDARRPDRRGDRRAGRAAPRRSPIRRTRSASRAGGCCSPARSACWSHRFWRPACRPAPPTWSTSARCSPKGSTGRTCAPDRTDRHYLWVGRVSGVAITMLGVLYAMFLIQSVLYTFLLTETLATFVGISVLGGIVWPRANRWGALASLLTRARDEFLAVLSGRPASGSTGIRTFSSRRSLAGIVALVVVSLLTRPSRPARIDVVLRSAADVERRRSPRAEGLRRAARRRAAAARERAAPAVRRGRQRVADVRGGSRRPGRWLRDGRRARRGDGVYVGTRNMKLGAERHEFAIDTWLFVRLTVSACHICLTRSDGDDA